MRKVKFKKWIPGIRDAAKEAADPMPYGYCYKDGTNCWSDFIHNGVLLHWGVATYAGEQTSVALIELPDGTVEEVLPSNIKFTTPCNTSA